MKSNSSKPKTISSFFSSSRTTKKIGDQVLGPCVTKFFGHGHVTVTVFTVILSSLSRLASCSLK